MRADRGAGDDTRTLSFKAPLPPRCAWSPSPVSTGEAFLHQNVRTVVSPAFASMPVIFFMSGYSPEFVTAMMTVS